MADCVEGVEEEGCCCIASPKGVSDRLYLAPDKQARIKGFAMAVYVHRILTRQKHQ